MLHQIFRQVPPALQVEQDHLYFRTVAVVTGSCSHVGMFVSILVLCSNHGDGKRTKLDPPGL